MSREGAYFLEGKLAVRGLLIVGGCFDPSVAANVFLVTMIDVFAAA